MFKKEQKVDIKTVMRIEAQFNKPFGAMLEKVLAGSITDIMQVSWGILTEDGIQFDDFIEAFEAEGDFDMMELKNMIVRVSNESFKKKKKKPKMKIPNTKD